MKFISLLLLISFSCSGQAQLQNDCKANLKECLIEFLISAKETSNKKDQSALFLVDLSDKSRNELFKTEKVILKPTIYTFGLLGPHYNNFLMVYQSNKVVLITDYSTESVLLCLSNFFKDHSKNFNEEQKIELVTNVLQILNLRNLNKTNRDDLDVELKH